MCGFAASASVHPSKPPWSNDLAARACGMPRMVDEHAIGRGAHMKTTRWLSTALVGVLILTQLAVATAAQSPKATNLGLGQPFCPTRTIVNNKVAVKQGNCYILFIMRDTKRTYLAFAPRDAKIAAGQVIRLDTTAGARLRKRILYLVPIKASVEIVPQNSIKMVAVKVDDFGTRVSLTILDTPAQNLVVMFSVRQSASR